MSPSWPRAGLTAHARRSGTRAWPPTCQRWRQICSSKVKRSASGLGNFSSRTFPQAARPENRFGRSPPALLDQLTSILRGCARSDFGTTTVSTPSFISARIFVWSTALESLKLLV